MKRILSAIFLMLLLLGLVGATSMPVQAAPAKTVMYFWGNGCPHCKEAAPIIDRIMAKGIPVEKYEVYENKQNADRLVMSLKMYGVPETEWGVPVAFYNGKMYMGTERIAELEKELSEVADAGGAGLLGTSDTLGIMGAALADSVNPCAILVLVLLLTFTSFIQESRKRLIWTAASFIFSVFVTYMLVGVGIVKAVTFLGLSEALRNIVGVIAIVVGLLNLKDWFAYRAGGFAIEIPRAWRPFLYKMLRKATNPASAFVMGVFATLVEFPCTGGPYFFALGILAKWGMGPSFFAYLALYNIIFVSPLIVISVLIYLGKLTLETATDWQAQYSRRLHLAAGLLMLAAGIAVLWTA